MINDKQIEQFFEIAGRCIDNGMSKGEADNYAMSLMMANDNKNILKEKDFEVLFLVKMVDNS